MDVAPLDTDDHTRVRTNPNQTIAQVFPMSEIREALEFMKTGKHVGKVRVCVQLRGS